MKLPEKTVRRLLPMLMAVVLAAGCGTISGQAQPGNTQAPGLNAAETEEIDTEAPETLTEKAEAPETLTEKAEAAETQTEKTEAISIGLPVPGLPQAFELSMVPEYDGTVWADVNDDIPFFDEKEMEAARLMAKALSQENARKETDPTANAGSSGRSTDEETAADESSSGRSTDEETAADGSSSEKAAEHSYQLYGKLDALGRCTGACALVGPETLPQEERGNIGMVKPTGWHTVKYDGIDGNYLYNRCHLIGFQLTGQDANDRNLITGTRFMNIEGMLPYEDSVLAYVKGTGNHVLYRVTPVFRDKNLLADGVLMEACSVEDPLVRFCAFCYNVQPGITIEYATGESTGPEFTGNDVSAQADDAGDVGNKSSAQADDTGDAGNKSSAQADDTGPGNVADSSVPNRSGKETAEDTPIGDWKFIVNVNSLKFHRPDCESVQKMSSKNMQGFNGTREELIEMGYSPCKNCNP